MSNTEIVSYAIGILVGAVYYHMLGIAGPIIAIVALVAVNMVADWWNRNHEPLAPTINEVFFNPESIINLSKDTFTVGKLSYPLWRVEYWQRTDEYLVVYVMEANAQP